jgi:hypothetical protein
MPRVPWPNFAIASRGSPGTTGGAAAGLLGVLGPWQRWLSGRSLSSCTGAVGVVARSSTRSSARSPWEGAARPRARKSNGTGLGLVIVKRTIEAHGGRTAAARAPAGTGLRFRIELPLAGART